MKKRLAIVVSHPIQHFCPQYASLAKHPALQVKVFFASALGMKKYIDPAFNREISWSNLQLDQFEHEFLNGELVLPANSELDCVLLPESLDKFEPDIVIVYGYFQKFSRRAKDWAIAKKVKLANISDSERKQKRKLWKELAKYFYVRYYFSQIDYFLTVGDANEAYYRYYGVPVRKLIRMRFPIDVRFYEMAFAKKAALANEVKSQYGLHAGHKVLSVVGKMLFSKRQGDIIDAMILLEKRNVFLDLLMVGSGEMETAWKIKAKLLEKSRVFFTGFISPDLLPSYYAASDIYVHPAAADAHSLAISEALYMGCPVIVSDLCGSYGPTDDVQEGRSGFVFQCGNIGDLCEKIEWMLRDDQKRLDMGEYGHQLGVTFQRGAHGEFADELIARLEHSTSQKHT